jgi:hypothetical protein
MGSQVESLKVQEGASSCDNITADRMASLKGDIREESL